MSSVKGNTLPVGWEEKKLGEILEIDRGGSPRPIKDYLTEDENGLNWIKIGDATNSISDKYIYETKQKIKPEGLYKTRLVKEGDFILSNSMSFGKPYIMKTEGCIHDGWLSLKIIDSSSLETDFLYYVLSSPIIYNKFRFLSSGTTVKNLNKAIVASVSIPLPPLEEQKRIVAKIDGLFTKIDKAISLTEESLKQAKNLLPSVLKEVFEKGKADGWEEKKLGEVFKDISSGFACSKRFEKDGGYVHLRTHNISTQGVLNFDKIIQIEENKVNIRSSKIFKGDVIFNNTNSTELVGKTSYVDKDYDYGYSNHLTKIKTSVESEGKYLTYFLNHLQWMGYFTRICKKWIGQSGVNTSMLKDLDYCYPSFEEQKEIVSMLDGISNQSIKTQSKLEEQLAYLKQLKSSILSKAFKGEL